MTNINLPGDAAVHVLSTHPLLQGLPPATAAALATHLLHDALPLSAKAGQILFVEGGVAQHYLLLVSGQAEVVRYAYNGDEHVFRIFEPGKLMAEAAMFMPHGRYPMQARARTALQGWRLCRQRLHEACQRWPDLALRLLSSLSQRLYDEVNAVDWLTSSSAPERLANYLIGLREDQGDTVTLPLNQRQLAAHLGIRAETLSRLLNDWQTRGHLSGSRRQWVLHAPTWLEQLAATAKRPF